MQDAAAGGHPLHVAGAHRALVAEAVAVLDRAGEHIGDRLDAAVRMPGEAGAIVVGTVVAEIVEQQERIELAGVAEAEGAVQLDAGAFDGGLDWMMRLTGRMDMGTPHKCREKLPAMWACHGTITLAGRSAYLPCCRGHLRWSVRRYCAEAGVGRDVGVPALGTAGLAAADLGAPDFDDAMDLPSAILLSSSCKAAVGSTRPQP